MVSDNRVQWYPRYNLLDVTRPSKNLGSLVRSVVPFEVVTSRLKKHRQLAWKKLSIAYYVPVSIYLKIRMFMTVQYVAGLLILLASVICMYSIYLLFVKSGRYKIKLTKYQYE